MLTLFQQKWYASWVKGDRESGLERGATKVFPSSKETPDPKKERKLSGR